LLVGYARVSTLEQHLDLQLDALTHAGCEKIFRDTISGAKSERPGLSQAIEFMRQGDVLVVWKLDRLGRSLRDLIDMSRRSGTRVSAFGSCKKPSTAPCRRAN
jgi:DNA invertase Pin-like site-specific DNA recombinase